MKTQTMIYAAGFLLFISACSTKSGTTLLEVASSSDDSSSTNVIEAAFFSGTTLIPLYADTNVLSVNGLITMNASSNIDYLVVGVFEGIPRLDDEGMLSTANLVAGTRTGISGFSRHYLPLTDFYAFDKTKNDFDATTPYYTTATDTAKTNTYRVLIWGFDSYGQIKYSSPARSYNVRWTNSF